VMPPLAPGASRWAQRQLLRAGLMTCVALGLLGLFATGSLLVAVLMFAGAGACVVAVQAWVRRRDQRPLDLPADTLWAGPATVRVADLLGCPLLDTVSVRRPGAARRRSGRGAPGTLVVTPDLLEWTAGLAAELGGVKGSFSVPWSSVVRAQAAAIPAATPGSGAIAFTFADRSKLDVAFTGDYRGFRAALTRLPRPLPGVAE